MKFLTLILAVFLMLIIPLFLIAIILFLLIRYLVKVSAKYVKPELGKMVTTRGNIFTTDDLYNKPQSNIVVVMTLEGNVDSALAIKTLKRTVMEARFPDGELKYPELKQYLTTWTGYFFWKNDKTFELKNHLKFHDSKSGGFTDEDLQEICQELMTKNWTKKRPLWEMIFIPNCYPKGADNPAQPHTQFILRFHHSLGDGYSWLSLLAEGMCEKPIKNAVPNYFKREPFAMFLYAITFPFRLAYNEAEMIMISLQELPFTIPSKMQTGDFNIKMSNGIPVRKLKEIKNHFKVNFSSVIWAVLAGAVRDMMIKKRMDIPMTLPTLTALPLPGHSAKLRNYMTADLLKLPTGLADPIARLEFSSDDYKNIKRSTTSTLMSYSLVIVGSLIPCMSKLLGNNLMATPFLSNFPAGFEYMFFNGHKCVNVMFTMGLAGGCGGLGFSALSYVDGFRISITASPAVLTTDELNEMTELIEKHVDMFHHLVHSGV